MVVEYSKDGIKSGVRMFYQGGTVGELEINTWRGIAKDSYVTTDLSFAMWWAIQSSRHSKLYPITYALAF